MLETFADFVTERVRGKRIVEVGVGFYLKVALRLKEMGYEVVVVDWNEEAVKNAKKHGLVAVKDDIFNPNPQIYENAEAIYSIRPTPEMMPDLLGLARSLRKPLFIVPLTGDPIPPGMRLVEFRRIPIYVYEPR
ncbi:UPF0146 family protein [Pyrococcus yayanosii]|uniref:UPF0146 protein PYCH_16640 n=1 Tax=Pyrococcus yayanosii (strain CH1 / JCM 16557) TaxID=529709 RepID=F8AH98_PYRYC|nr:UPF0146 family protein [Pyrococcus yayanosii]AEH25330.1 hypothetical protein PYCH_16640 [Pyrococcus yayanosii CH1]